MNCERENHTSLNILLESQFLNQNLFIHKKVKQMKNSINNLRNQFTSTEMLSATQLCAIKGGGGEDIRKALSTTTKATVSAILVVVGG